MREQPAAFGKRSCDFFLARADSTQGFPGDRWSWGHYGRNTKSSCLSADQCRPIKPQFGPKNRGGPIAFLSIAHEHRVYNSRKQALGLVS